MKNWELALDILLILLSVTSVVLVASARKKTAEAVEEGERGKGAAK